MAVSHHATSRSDKRLTPETSCPFAEPDAKLLDRLLDREPLRAVERGELKHDVLVKYPQLLPAPMLLAIMWQGLFDRFEPLDVRALMRAHFEILFGDRSAP